MSHARRQFFLVAARDWLGTPFHMGARIPGEGVDCVQLIIAAGMAAGLIDEPRRLQNYPRLTPRNMTPILEDLMDQVDPPGEPGDILWINTRGNRPLHFAILTDSDRILHASADARCVVETQIPIEYRARIDSIWTFKDLKNG